MKNEFIFSDNYKRYHTYDYHLHKKYGVKTAKITLDAGFSCPHTDAMGGGCIYCSKKYHSPKGTILKSPEMLLADFYRQQELIRRKWKNFASVAYFQTGSNTFAGVDELRKIFEPFIALPEVRGIDIATRPDCLPDVVLDYLSEMGERTDLTVELGLQTMHDPTAKLINRGYTLGVFEAAYKKLAERGIRTVLHIINSLPGESAQIMIETARYISSLNPLPLGVKIHMLNVVRTTELAKFYADGGFSLMNREEYIETVVRQLELLPPELVIMRLTGDPEADELIAPEWCLKKFTVINDIDKKFIKEGTYQGRKSGRQYLKYNQDEADNMENSDRQPKNYSLTSILPMAKSLLGIALKENGVYADFTAGKGNDTLWLRKTCPSAKIYAFDIQKEAIEFTRTRLTEENCLYNIELINDSHASFPQYIKENLDGAVFNLGFLPGGNKTITTLTTSTLNCLSAALERLNRRGIIVVVVYPGHEEGTNEGEAVLRYAQELDRGVYDCLLHRLVNILDAPYIIAFQKKV